MAAQTQISVEEYFRTRFEGPTPEYVDGELVERHMAGIAHSSRQRSLLVLFEALRKDRPLHAYPELHLRLARRRYRIADIAVFAGEQPAEDIPSQPPLIVSQILSPDDSFQEVIDKFEELRAWGVKHLWLIHPRSRKLFVYDGGLREVAAFTIPDYNVELAAAAIFA